MRAGTRITVGRVADGALWVAAGLGVLSLVVALLAIVAHMPHAGAVLGSPWTGGVLVGLLGAGSAVALRRRYRWRSRQRLVAAGVALAVGVSGMAVRPGLPTLAYWTDSGELTTGTFTAHSVGSPASIACFNEGGVLGLLGYVRMNWAHVDTRYVYDWRVIRNSNGQVPASGTITPPAGTAQGAPINQEIRIGLLDIGLANIEYTFEVTARLRDTNWSAGTVVTSGFRTQQLLVGLSVRCSTP